MASGALAVMLAARPSGRSVCDGSRCVCAQAQPRVFLVRVRRRRVDAAGAMSDLPAQGGVGPQAVAPVQPLDDGEPRADEVAVAIDFLEPQL